MVLPSLRSPVPPYSTIRWRAALCMALWLALGTALPVALGAAADRPPAPLRMATFKSDVTPPLGAPLIGIVPAATVEDPLFAKGIVLDDGGRRYVLCAVDWCELMNSTHDLFRRKIAKAAGTDPAHVAVQCVHQHTAPQIDGDAYALLADVTSPPLGLSEAALDDITNRLASAVRESLDRLEPFDRVGTSEARVERVASTRRLRGDGGKIVVRYSTDAKIPALAAAPEGDIDPMLKTITLARGERPLVRLHYYACHPQTHQLDGIVSKDFVGQAREAVEAQENVFQIHFTGCAGDVTVGKYNDGAVEAREGLRRRLEAALKASNAAARWAPAESLSWRVTPLSLPKKIEASSATAVLEQRLADRTKFSPYSIYGAAVSAAFSNRRQPILLSALRIGPVYILHLPGEPMVAFQRFAQRARPEAFVAVAGYGDCGPGYICTDQAYVEGGYEPSASHAGPGTEALVKQAIRELLEVAQDAIPR